MWKVGEGHPKAATVIRHAALMRSPRLIPASYDDGDRGRRGAST
jgi:hypothetical protein